ncbi:response regulator [Candidatus Kaiserbacteria bacterium]|nr:response regulator [Candidatus Kaiserbacteria bacterium]
MMNKKILIVDDDENILRTLGKLFESAGAKVSTASSYEAGVAAIKSDAPDIAIVDLMLPQHTGLELVKETKADAPKTFFVMLTNSINAEHVADAMEANVTMYVQKADHDPEDIVKMVADRFK